MTQKDIDYIKDAINWLSSNVSVETKAELETRWSFTNNSLELLDNLKPTDSTELSMPDVGQSFKCLMENRNPNCNCKIDQCFKQGW